jgi:class 3 adenylate cyclase
LQPWVEARIIDGFQAREQKQPGGASSGPPPTLEPQSVTVTRRLAAILAADAANFSRLVAQDEERTLQVLAGHRTVIDETIRTHGGRIVTTAGDSVLAEFASPVQAVRAAIEIQRALLRRNTDSGLRNPMLFRIGVNVGDVVVDRDDILGDDVNVAVRLENLAPPGGICISASVREHISGKVDARLQDLGTQFLKNIPRPVRVYQVIADMAAPGSVAPRARQAGTTLMLGVAAAAIALAIGAWFSLRTPIGEHARTQAGTGIEQLPASSEERAFWDSVRQASDPAELRTYLDKYPGGTFSELAQARLDGLVAARQRREEEEEAMAKAAEALRAQAEALRLRGEAEAAIARAALEQETAARLKDEAEAAAQHAAAASRAAAEAQQRLGRTNTVALPEPVALLRTTSALDGRWAADWTCEASAEGPAATLRLPAQIEDREIRIEAGQVGLPGHFRAYGSIADDGGFKLQGTHMPRTQRIVGNESALQAWGRLEGERLEGSGSIGKRRCSLVLTRAGTP